MEESADDHQRKSIKSVQILSNFKQQKSNVKIQQIILSLMSGLEHVDKDFKLQLLKMLVSLGEAAAEDLRCLMIVKDEQQELGITGAHLSPRTVPCSYVSDDLFGYKQEPLPEDKSLDQFQSLLRKCQEIVYSVEPLSLESLENLLQLEDDLMVKFRRHKALCSFGLGLPAKNEKDFNSSLHALFKQTYKLISNFGPSATKALGEFIKCAWVWEDGPAACIKDSNTNLLENLTLRIYGIEIMDCLSAKVFLKQDDANLLNGDQQRSRVEKKPSQEDGTVLHLSKICMKNLQGARKTSRKTVDVKLYRVVCEIPVMLTNTSPPILFRCSSLPFTVRTGSPQLWPYTSYVIWHIWTQEDLRLPDSKCPRELHVSSILGLIQARVIGAGLTLSSKALWDSMKWPGMEDQISLSSFRLPHKLTDGERQGWTETIRKRCGSTSERNLDMISRHGFTHSTTSKNTCLWVVVSAAVNTGLRLKRFALDRFFHIGLPNDMCRSFPEIEIGNFILRSSLNRLENTSGQEPLAKVIIQVCTNEQVEPVIKEVADFDNWKLQEIVSEISIGSIDNKCVRRILPGYEDVCTIEELGRGDQEELINPEGYPDSIRQIKRPSGVHFSGLFEGLSLSSSSPRSPAFSNMIGPDSITSSPAALNSFPPEDEHDDEPLCKKNALLEDMHTEPCNAGMGTSNQQTCETVISQDTVIEADPKVGLNMSEVVLSNLSETDSSLETIRLFNEDVEQYIMNDVVLSSGSDNDVKIGDVLNMPQGFLNPDTHDTQFEKMALAELGDGDFSDTCL